MAAELLPADKQLPTLLRKVTLAAQETGVLVRDVPAGAATRPSSTTPRCRSRSRSSGDYHDVGSFLAELANMRRIITVTHLEHEDRAESQRRNGHDLGGVRRSARTA